MSDLPKSRRLAREMAFQALYNAEVGKIEATEAAESILERQPLAPSASLFLRTVVGGVHDAQFDIDSIITPCLAERWGIDRLAVTDLMALRIAVFELYHLPGMPPKVTISQAVEIAQKFGGRESGRFVNGVLANVFKNSPKFDWDPSQEEAYDPADDYVAPELVDEDLESFDEVIVEPGTPEAAEFDKLGAWVVRTQE